MLLGCITKALKVLLNPSHPTDQSVDIQLLCKFSLLTSPLTLCSYPSAKKIGNSAPCYRVYVIEMVLVASDGTSHRYK